MLDRILLDQSDIDEVVYKFNFVKCNTVMALIGWTWAVGNGGVPSIPELIKTARQLLDDVMININAGASWHCVQTGGLKAEGGVDSNSNTPWLELSFVLTNAELSRY